MGQKLKDLFGISLTSFVLGQKFIVQAFNNNNAIWDG